MKMKMPHIGFFSLCIFLLSGALISCSKSDKPAPAMPVAGFEYEQVNQNFILPRFQLTDTSKNATEWNWSFSGYAAPTTERNPVVTFYRINYTATANQTVKNEAGQSTTSLTFNTGANGSHIASYTFPSANIYEDFSNNNKEWTSEHDPVSEVGVNGKGSSGKFTPAQEAYVRPPLHMLNEAFEARKQISVSMWVKVSDLTHQGGIFGVADELFTTYIPAIFYANNKLYGRWPGNQVGGHIASQTITANTWYHIVLNGDGITSKHEMFVNGVSAGVTDDGVSFGSGTNTMYKAYLGWSKTEGWPEIGNGPAEKYFAGNISAVRFFNRIISQDEVNALYHEFD